MSLKDVVENSLWIEKYKPRDIEDVLIEESVKERFRQFVDKKEIPNLVFPGNPGNGKTTCARILAKAVSDDVMFINASDESGVDVVRNKIEPFCAVESFGDTKKVIILDEMEESSHRFQTALRAVIEQFYSTTRFILTCNFYNKVIDPIKSRTQEFKFGEINQKEILKRCFYILKNEGVEFDKKNVAKVLKHLGTDMRRIIQTLQKLTMEKDGKRVLIPYTSDEEKMLKLFELVDNNKLTDFRKYIIEQNMAPDQIAIFLFNKVFEKKLGDENWQEMVGVMGECIDRINTTASPEITLVHHVLQLMQLKG